MPTAQISASARPLTREPIRSPRVAIPILSPSPSVSVLNAMLNNSNPPLLTIGSYFGVRHDDTYEIDFEPDRPRGARLGRHGLCGDRKSVVEGKRVAVRVDRGGRRIIKKKNK